VSSSFLNTIKAVFRELNLSSVLRHLDDQTTLPQAQKAIFIGLNKSTLSSPVEELIQRGLIKRIPGDPLSPGENNLLSAIQASGEKHSFSVDCQQIEILASKFGKDANIIGPFTPGVNDILLHPTHVGKEVISTTS
jgi:hypothetical protein